MVICALKGTKLRVRSTLFFSFYCFVKGQLEREKEKERERERERREGKREREKDLFVGSVYDPLLVHDPQ